jgi:hypothetical protein
MLESQPGNGAIREGPRRILLGQTGHSNVDPAFDKALAFGAKGLLNAVDTFINSQCFTLAAGAAKHKLPFVSSDVEYVIAGGLMSIGPGHYEGYYGAAKYVARVCMAQILPTCLLPAQRSSAGVQTARR